MDKKTLSQKDRVAEILGQRSTRVGGPIQENFWVAAEPELEAGFLTPPQPPKRQAALGG
ncbi:MAG: hypothetical protein HYT63_01610 [Candidatus Yanofskybacteria bacterium]|nr:hypothetical protein [Candidatus Yanofskybacteria bacterium]